MRIGTPVKELTDACGGFAQAPEKVLAGGPMMGMALVSLEAPVEKGTSGIIALAAGQLPEEGPCIRCGRCLEVCPIRLMPLDIATAGYAGDVTAAEKLHALDCIECGCCTYVCPARRRILTGIRVGKGLILRNRREARGETI